MGKAKQKRGLPDSFGLDLPESATQAPIQIGDYLDEDHSPVVPTARAQATAVAEPPSVAPNQVIVSPKVVAFQREPEERPTPEPVIVTQESPQPVARRAVLSPPKRKQINMKPETQRKAEELLGYIQTYSVQSDAKASEMFDGIISLLHDSKEHLDLSGIPPRGKWGSPTARAFPTNLKNAFEQAVIANHQTKQE